jgi:putative glutamine amidotransferase
LSVVIHPIIAVPSYPRLAEGRVKGWHTDGIGVPIRYVEALRRAGGIEAIVMTEDLDDDEVEDLLDRVDGLLLLGGGDLDPRTYHEEAHTKVYGVSEQRDATELALARAALGRDFPVLAICRGHQILNVALGGALEQHLPDLRGVDEHGQPGVAGGALEHEVKVEPGTRLAAVMGGERATASCHHHQAVDEPGQGLRVVARADDGIIEATELADPGAPWVVSVQWHPEDTAATDPAQQRLFDTLVAEARPDID